MLEHRVVRDEHLRGVGQHLASCEHPVLGDARWMAHSFHELWVVPEACLLFVTLCARLHLAGIATEGNAVFLQVPAENGCDPVVQLVVGQRVHRIYQ